MRERRWWAEDQHFVDGAVEAARLALEQAGVDPSRIGLLVNTSVSRSHLEPSIAVDVHAQLGLATHCLNFDLTNACLGFVNGMNLAAQLIDAGSGYHLWSGAYDREVKDVFADDTHVCVIGKMTSTRLVWKLPALS